MKRIFVATAVAVAMLPSAFLSHALAAADSEYAGGCGANFASDPIAGQGQVTGTIDVEVVAFSQGTPADNPVSATVTCYITVNGVPQPGATISASGTAVILGTGVVTFTSNASGDDVQLCINVDFTSNATPDVNSCDEATPFDTGVMCAVLRLLAGFQQGPLRIGWDGDVWYENFRIIDCPPQGNWS